MDDIVERLERIAKSGEQNSMFDAVGKTCAEAAAMIVLLREDVKGVLALEGITTELLKEKTNQLGMALQHLHALRDYLKAVGGEGGTMSDACHVGVDLAPPDRALADAYFDAVEEVVGDLVDTAESRLAAERTARLEEALRCLVDEYIANRGTVNEFVTCITPNEVPAYWRMAIDLVYPPGDG